MTAIPPHDEGVHTPAHLPHDDCDHVLAALADGRACGDDGLSQLLRAAAAPAQRGELLGRGIALAAYQDRFGESGPRGRRRVWPGAVVLKAAAVFILAASGAAAAATAAISTPMFAVAQPQAAPERHRLGGEGLVDGRSSPTASPTPVAAQVVRELCRSYHKLAPKDRSKELQGTGFTLLVAAAGGTPNVEAYCVDLLHEPKAEPSPTTSKVDTADTGGDGSKTKTSNGKASTGKTSTGKTSSGKTSSGTASSGTASNGKTSSGTASNGKATTAGRTTGSAPSRGPQPCSLATNTGNGRHGTRTGKVAVTVRLTTSHIHPIGIGPAQRSPGKRLPGIRMGGA